MSHMLPWASGPLTSLESIAKVPNRQVAKMGKSSIFWLSFFFFLLSVNCQPGYHDNGWSYYNDSNAKKWHKSLGTALTTYRDLSTRTILQWFSSTLMSILSAICHFVRMTLFIACTPPPWPEAQLSTCLIYCYRERWRWQQRSSGGIT